MTSVVRFSRFVELCQRLRATPGRLDKLALLADYLRSLPADAIETAVAFLTARAFPAPAPRVLGVRALPAVAGDAAGPPLTLADVAAAFAAVADAGGAGSARNRRDMPRAARAPAA